MPKNLLSLDFWFSTRPGFLSPLALKVILALTIVLIVSAIALKIITKLKNFDVYFKRLFNKLAALLGWMGIILGILLFFGYERAPILSMRFFYLLWTAGLAVWVFFIVKYALTIPKLMKEMKDKKEFEKYLPKKD